MDYNDYEIRYEAYKYREIRLRAYFGAKWILDRNKHHDKTFSLAVIYDYNGENPRKQWEYITFDKFYKLAETPDEAIRRYKLITGKTEHKKIEPKFKEEDFPDDFISFIKAELFT